MKRIGQHLAPLRYVAFLVALLAGFAAFRWLPGWAADWREALALGFDIAAALFLLTLLPLLRDSKVADIRRHARENDANRVLVLVVTTLLALVVMAAIGGELPGARAGDALAIAKLMVTQLLIWLFAGAVFALHYAHAYYASSASTGGDAGGLEFPGTPRPDYSDFAYFALTLGMTFQTSDVGITAPAIRRIALLHSFAAFLFNIGVIAFTINVLGGGN